MTKVLVTRPKADAVTMSALLKERGYDTLIEPMLFMQPVEDAEKALKLALREPYQAIAVTSRHALPFLIPYSRVHELPIFVVGDATAEAAKKIGFPVIKQAGEAAEIPGLIQRLCNPIGPKILYVRGEDVTLDLANSLKGSRFGVNDVLTYRMKAADTLSDTLTKELVDGGVDIMTFFSARTGQTFAKLVREAKLEKALGRVHAACFSDKVADALDGLPFKAVSSCDRPRVDTMLREVDKIARAG